MDAGCRDIAASPCWCSRSCSRPSRRSLRQQQVMDGALDAIALGLVAGCGVGRQRLQRRAVAPGGGDGLGGSKNSVHLQRPVAWSGSSSLTGSNASRRLRFQEVPTSGLISDGNRPALQVGLNSAIRRDRPSRASRGAPALPPKAWRSDGPRAASARSARRSPRNSRRCCPRCAAARSRSWRSACAGGRGRAVRWRDRFRKRPDRRDRGD